MIIDHRTYTMHGYKVPKWLALYEQYGLPLQSEHLGNLIGFFQTEIGPLNQVIHLWGFESMAERERRRALMVQDPRWDEFMRRSEELGAVMTAENKIIRPVGFSPIQ